MKCKLAVPVVSTAIAAATLLALEPATGQDTARDPGVRPGPAGAGGPIDGLTKNEIKFFEHGKTDFVEVEKVEEGLGPTMNLDGCGTCHSQPAIGGSSPKLNPQVAFAQAANPSQYPAVQAFIKPDGPVREARFVRNPDGTPDGGVHALFTITGREGADSACNPRQADFNAELQHGNVIFRIPTPVFGAGLIEQIPDAAIVANMAANASQKSALGISGRPNRNGNDGTISRFGWKAQNQSLLLFSGEAYNVEMGITNELFQSERQHNAGCDTTVPNDTQDLAASDALTGTTAIQNFANFQRFLAPPKPSADTPGGAASIKRGRGLFVDVGCALCHTPTLRTSAKSSVFALNNREVNLFSDLLLHHMGVRLADGVSQGAASASEFRTSPLWGLGQRIFFLHDGRTSDLKVAIREHASEGSEANGVIGLYKQLSESQKQDLLNFLRSL
jgi:CxxC motif-containing protein (DUF1111 family)